MAHFYLNIRNGGGYSEDPDGIEANDLETAKARAIEGARSLLSEEVCEGRLDLSGAIEITDSHRALLMVVPFDKVVELTLKEAAPRSSPSLMRNSGAGGQ